MITYNHEKYIIQAIDSILMQETEYDYELIIANDCSPDNTDSIVENYLKHHPKSHIVKYFRHKENIGISNNANFALKQCTGQFIAICEGDDYWTDTHKLQKQADYMLANPNLSFTFHGSKTIDENGALRNYYKHPRFKDKEIVPINAFLEKAGASYATASNMLKREVITDFPDWYLEAHIGDYPVMFLALEEGDIGYLEDIMCVYRINVSTGWSVANKSIKARLLNFKKMVALNRVINIQTKGKYRRYLKLTLAGYIFNKIVLLVKNKLR